MTTTIEIPDELYERLGTHAKAFETPAQVIARLLDAVSDLPNEVSTSGAEGPNQPVARQAPLHTGKLEINFYPSDPMAFKAQLLERREAWVRLSYQDGSSETKNWIARYFKRTSDVLGNLRSGYLRAWREKGIVRADIAIERSDLPAEGE